MALKLNKLKQRTIATVAFLLLFTNLVLEERAAALESVLAQGMKIETLLAH